MTTDDEEYPNAFTVGMSALLFVENIAAFIFNVTVLLVFHLQKHTRERGESNVFITSLNVLDIIVSLTTVPMTTALMLSSRYQTKLFCYFHEASISFASSASATNLLIISLDRYDSVLYPFNRHLDQKYVKYVVVLIWIVSWFGFCTPFYGYGFANQQNSTRLPCAKWFHISRINNYYYELYYVFIYIISNTVMIICYWRIFRQSRKTRLHFRRTLVKLTFIQSEGHGHSHENRGRIEKERRLAKVSMAIVISFMCCWGPHAILSTALVIISEHTMTLEMLQIGFLSLAYFSGLLHPMLYAFMRKSFRDALVSKFRRRSGSKVAPLIVMEPSHHRRMSVVSRRSSLAEPHNGQARRNTVSSSEEDGLAALARRHGEKRLSPSAEESIDGEIERADSTVIHVQSREPTQVDS